jgi:ABC-type transport system involved in multi-copper enzyme maturation permease subunit
MHFGPIFRYELTRVSRRRGFYVVRALLGLIMLSALEITRQGIVGGEARYDDPRNLPWLAIKSLLQLIFLQSLAMILIVPGLVVMAITEEDRRGTMLDLLSSPLSIAAIVFGKLAARLVQVGAFLAIALPMIALFGVLGALRFAIMIRAEALLAALTLFVASLSLLVATVIPRPRRALVAAYLLVGGWLVLGVAVTPLVRRLAGPLSWLGPIHDAYLLSHPGLPALYLGMIPEEMLSGDPADAAWAWARLNRTLPWTVGIQAVCSLVFGALAIVLLRPVRLGWRRRGLPGWRRSTRVPAAPGHPPVGDDPMLWKEQHATARPAWPAGRLTLVLFGGLVLYPLIGPVREAFQECRQSGPDATAQIHRRFTLNQSLRDRSAGLSLLGFAAVAAVAATSVTGEQERRTWTSLTTTLLTGREVARAKVAGALGALRGPATILLVLWVVGLATGAVHPLGVLAAALGLFVFARCAAAAGVLISMVSRSSERALAATLFALVAVPFVALLFLPINLIGPLAQSRHGLVLAFVAPFVEWVALVSSFEIAGAPGGWIPEGSISIPGYFWRINLPLGLGLVRIFAISLVAHALVTSAAIGLAARAYDRGGHA